MTHARRLRIAPDAGPPPLPGAPVVIWQDVECGPYTADLALWRELAREAGGPLLDVGAGVGRVALHLARLGHAVTALDRHPDLLAALGARAAAEGLGVETVVADAAGFDLGPAAYALVLVPMQTVQLLPGAPARARLLASARRHLLPGGRLALALATDLEGFEAPVALPPPDLGERAGWRFLSQPVAVRELGDRVRIERVRQAVAPDGSRTEEPDAVELIHLGVAELEAEGRAAGLTPAGVRAVAATDDHVGAEVVILRA